LKFDNRLFFDRRIFPPETLKPSKTGLTPTDKALKTTATAILLIAGTWLILKISKAMLKELEGMGL